MKDFNQFIHNLKDLCGAPSVRGDATENMPFGKGVNDSLLVFQRIVEKMGFITINHQNYLLEFSHGEGEEIGIIGHLDVVPTGDNWNTSPFTLTEIDGRYYARGIIDDKAPTLLSLYALKELVDEGLNFNKKIRFFVGTNEESGWADIDYFIKNGGKFPEYGFSPDGEFPLSYAEKGIFPTEFTIPAYNNFGLIEGGTAINQVCDYARVKPFFTPDQLELDKFDLEFDGEFIVSHGIAAHGSTPELGKNAIKPLLEYMLYKGENVQKVLDCLFYDRENLSKMTSEQGSITLSPNLASNSNGKQSLSCDVRVPYPFTLKDLEQKFQNFGLLYRIIEQKHQPTCVPKDGWFVKALLDAYNKVMGENANPISMGGSTYARAFKFGCAFGPSFPNQDNGIHKPNEFMTKEQMLKTFEIYKQALINIVK